MVLGGRVALRRCVTDGRLTANPVPTAETWADGDRDVMCVVYNRDGRLAGSAVPLAR